MGTDRLSYSIASTLWEALSPVYKALPGRSHSLWPHLSGVASFCRLCPSFPTCQKCRGRSPSLLNLLPWYFPPILLLSLPLLSPSHSLFPVSFTFPLLFLIRPLFLSNLLRPVPSRAAFLKEVPSPPPWAGILPLTSLPYPSALWKS